MHNAQVFRGEAQLGLVRVCFFAGSRRGHGNQTVVLKLVLRNTNGCGLMRTDCPVNPGENSLRGENTDNRSASVRIAPQREEEDPFAD